MTHPVVLGLLLTVAPVATTVVEDPPSTDDVAGELVVVDPVASDDVAVCEIVTDRELLLVAEVEFAGIGVASRPQPSAASETLSP
jgi:hypothetical protein